jgi:hypothetical protein
LIVEPDLASTDEDAVVTWVVEDEAEEDAKSFSEQKSLETVAALQRSPHQGTGSAMRSSASQVDTALNSACEARETTTVSPSRMVDAAFRSQSYGF